MWSSGDIGLTSPTRWHIQIPQRVDELPCSGVGPLALRSSTSRLFKLVRPPLPRVPHTTPCRWHRINEPARPPTVHNADSGIASRRDPSAGTAGWCLRRLARRATGFRLCPGYFPVVALTGADRTVTRGDVTRFDRLVIGQTFQTSWPAESRKNTSQKMKGTSILVERR